MIRAPGFLADLDVPFMPRFSLYCCSGDGGGGGGDGDVDEEGESTAAPAAPGPVGQGGGGTGPGSISAAVSAGVAAVNAAAAAESQAQADADYAANIAGSISSNPHIDEAPVGTGRPSSISTGHGGAGGSLAESEAEAAATVALDNPYGDTWGGVGQARGPFAATVIETVEPPSGMGLTGSNVTTEGIANAMGQAGELSGVQGLHLGAAKAGVLDAQGNLNPLSLISPAMSLIASAANAPHGSLGIHGLDDPSDPDPTGEGGAIGGPSDAELRDEYPIGARVVSASSDAAPDVADTSAATSAATSTTTSASAAQASDITPSPATPAPGTLIRRRRRTRTILTTPQGLLGGEGSALRGTRRTRSLPRKTLLGG
jgi:hypothetical protein